jgi:hypothetical protein
MKIKPKLNTKALQVDKTQSRIIGTVVVATIITVFCLVSTKVLIGQALYQRRVINARHASAQSLNTNIANANKLIDQYNNVFIGNSAKNIINGRNIDSENVNGAVVITSPPDGDNGRIVTDALPTKYDFPALLTSISKLLSDDGVGSPSIGGADDAGNVSSDPTSNPSPSKIDITLSGTGTYASAEKLINDLQRSIRPMDVTHLTLSGNQSNLSVSLNLTTYYQPAKTLTITSQEIK